MSQFNILHLAVNNPAKTGQKTGVKVLLSNQEIDEVDRQVDKGVDRAVNKIGENALDGKGMEKNATEGEGLKPGVVSRRNEVSIVDERDGRPFDRANILKRLASKGIYTTSKNVNAKPDGGLEESKMDENVADATESEALADSIIPPSIEFTKSVAEKSTVKPGPIIKRYTRKPKVLADGEEKEAVDKPKKRDEPKDYGEYKADSEDELRFREQLPKPVSVHRVKTSNYYMNNRKKFLSQLIPLFSNYKRELSDADKVASCDASSAKTDSVDFKLMIHQQVVRDYLNLYTPYRGLLLYHGLGSGKTCTSIAIAEGMKSQKQVFVLTLAALKANFFDQMKVCGDPIYKLDQCWKFTSTEGQPHLIRVFSKLLNLTEKFVGDHGGAWMVDIKSPSNFKDLTDEEKKSLNIQIDEMIRSKYKDLNYNGLTKKIMDDITDNYSKNPFDNSVVIIDEVHNFVSRIVNKTKEQTSISYRLYEYLMSATNARIVLLSGTPIINYPNEIGILFNILRGYIKTWTFPFTIEASADKPSREAVLSWFKTAGINKYDYVEFAGQQLTVTRNPFGFVNKYDMPQSARPGHKGGKSKKKQVKKPTRTKKSRAADESILIHKNGLISINKPIEGSQLDETDENRNMRIRAEFDVQTGGGIFEDYTGVELDDTGNMSDVNFKKAIITIMESHGIKVESRRVTVTNNKALPDSSKEFLETFIELGAKEMKDERVFQKRILGLTSYFKGADESLYPKFIPSSHDNVYHIEKIPMSEYQFGIYEKIRNEESKREKQNKKTQAKRDKNKDAADLFKIPSTYRIASRMCCNFAFPDPPGRPQKQSGEKGGDDEIGEEEVEEEEIGAKRGRKNTKGGAKKGIDIEEDEEEEEEELPKPDKVTANKSKPKKVTFDDETEEEDDDEEKEDETEEDEEPLVKSGEDVILEGVEDLDAEDEKEEEEEKEKLDYPKRMQRALAELKSRSEEFLVPSGLRMYSPKFLKILENIQNKENVGLHLIYSQFRSMEGVGILKLVMEANGFAELKLRRSGREWELDENPEDIDKPKFALHTGTETDEEKKIILNIYNSKWGEIPSSIAAAFKDRGFSNNHMGQVARVLMITASGAEGINLKNTRFVHIVEPYWHMVRLEQVIGRARRICSHQDLPEPLRTVKVFLYMAVLGERHRKDEKNIELRMRDKSKLSSKAASDMDQTTLLGRYVRQLEVNPGVVTTDEQLFENALIKDHVNSQILTAVKETAMDCRLYEKQNKDENLVCFSFGNVSSNAFGSYPTLKQDIAEKDVEETREVTSKLIEFTYKGIKYALNERTGDIYDFKEAMEKIKNPKSLTAIGKITGKGKSTKVELF